MKKKFLSLLFIIYVLIAIFTTICLLSYNRFKITEFGDKSLLMISGDEMAPTYHDGDLVIADKKSKVITGEKAFFYMTSDRKVEIKLATVEAIKTVTNDETTYTLEGGTEVSSQYLVGTEQGAEIIPNVGKILMVLESKWGFLFLIVMPSLILFIYQISVVISEIKNDNDDDDKK